MIDKIYQAGRRFYNDFLHFSDFAKALTIIGLICLAILSFWFVKRFSILIFGILLFLVALRIYYLENSHHIFWRNSIRLCTQVVLQSFVRKGLVLRNVIKLDTLNNQISERVRKANLAIFELELAKDEVNPDYVSDDVLTFEAQDAWQRYLLDHAERSAFQVARVSLIDQHSYYLMHIVLKNNSDVTLLDRDKVYKNNDQDDDF